MTSLLPRFNPLWSNRSDENHTAEKIMLADRVRNYPKRTLHADDGFLFCSTCNISIDHTRKHRKHKIDKYLESASQNTTGKQQTLKTAFECKTSPQVEKIVQSCTITHTIIDFFSCTIGLQNSAQFSFFPAPCQKACIGTEVIDWKHGERGHHHSLTGVT